MNYQKQSLQQQKRENSCQQFATKELYQFIYKYQKDVYTKSIKKNTQNIFQAQKNKIIQKPEKSTQCQKLDLRNQNFEKETEINSFLEVAPAQIDKDAVINEQQQNSKKISCTCRMSSCLKLNCNCFKNGKTCDESCVCLNCRNLDKFKEQRDQVILERERVQEDLFENQVEMFNGMKFSKYGCDCKKGCKNKRCICVKLNLRCSPQCRCGSCLNEKFVHSNHLDMTMQRYRLKRKYPINKKKQEANN